MSKIRSIADEIREKIRAEVASEPAEKSVREHVAKPKSSPNKIVGGEVSESQIHDFFEQISAFRMVGSQKIMIRLDPASMKLLKQLKFTRDIDMTKVIVFAFSKFLSDHHWLHGYVRELLTKTENEL